MTRIAILSPCLVQADATSNDALGMYQTLTGLGHEVRLFAHYWDVAGLPVAPAHKAPGFLKDPTALLLYHYSVGWDDGLEVLRTVPCRRIVKYHNVTPPEFYEDLSPVYTAQCEAGREQLPVLARAGYDLYLSDSAFNQAELIAAGAPAEKCAVVFPFHQIDRLQLLEAELDVLDDYRDGTRNLLSVGRLVPNKGHLTLIDAFAAYHHRHERASRLVIVGKGEERLRAYTDALRARAAGRGVADDVVFTGEVSDQALKAYYLAADVFLTASAHEGFCVPLVEAMALKLPIVAYGSTAIPATVGPAGLVWEELDSDLLAESVHCLVQDEELAAGLGRLGQQRYQQLFTRERIRERFVGAMAGML